MTLRPSLLCVLFAISSAVAADPLWQIGKADKDNREFALAPGGYANFKEDGCFVVGQSDAKRDWPYVHPGPADGWAGSRPHTFTILFALKNAPSEDCKLTVDLVDTQKLTPPELRIDINGKSSRRQMPPGGGDASVMGEPANGKPHRVEIAVPASQLKTGLNEIGITTLSGSWILYDCVMMEAPGAQLDQARNRRVGH